jgi:hypothetical protein
MKNLFIKNYLKTLTLFVLMVSCQSNKNEAVSSNSTIEKDNTSQKKDMVSSKDLQSKTSISDHQFGSFFPKEIGAYKLIEVTESTVLSRSITSAFYVKGDNMKNNMEYSVEDGHKKGSSVLKDFDISYTYQNKGEGETEYIYKERNGYKTIAFLQPEENRNEIRFIYNQRFSIILEGADDPDTLWTYIKEEDLKKLDKY